MHADITLERAYDPSVADGRARILIDRLWPRGVARAPLHLDAWLKDVAPSPALRRWFGHLPARFAAFRQRYDAELDAGSPALNDLIARCHAGPVTLIYGARDPACNHARVLRDWLMRHMAQERGRSGGGTSS